ncbi:MAG: T9SS type A sorting domain-containing protein, partial [Pseudomonas sp.]|nr:T9SS type A sorting domain-containing protein [Pseudomonas sp.]
IEVTTTGGVTAPTITSPTATSITDVSATLGGNITSDGGSSITERGTVWKTSAGVTITDNKLAEGGTSTGVFTHSRTSLPVGSQIFYRAYATNAIGTTLSDESSFYTLATEPSAHPTGFGATANSSSEITVSWTDSDAAGYLIKGSSVGYGDIAVPVDGTAETNNLLVQNVASGVQTFQFTGLTASTPYFFKIYPYNGSAATINYKTDGVQQADATTDEAPLMTVVNFDDDAKWTAGSSVINSYASDHTYIDGVFSSTGGPALRNTTTAQDGFPGALGTYSWRLNDVAAEWTVTISSGGIKDFSLDIRRWDGTPSPDYNLDWSIDNGSNWTTVATIGNTSLNNSSDWKTFSGTINSGVDNILVRLNSTGTTERIMVDNFSWSPFSTNPATSIYTNTGTWTNASNWSNGLPGETTDVTIDGNVTINVVAECNDMTISPTGAVTVGAGKELYVFNNLLIESNATGTGSFIGAAADYAIGETTTIQRYLTGGWDGWDAGWHQLSSPVAAQSISAFATGSYDFYGWEESTNMWMNYKAAGFAAWNGSLNFNVGQGYLVSYEAANTTQTFIGELNTTDVTRANLTTNGGSYDGWNLLGNPFASALKWNDANWTLNNVAGVAKIWSEAGKSYSDVEASTGIIPSAQGFMVQVSSATSLTIPAASRVHDATPFYKSGNEKLVLVAAETEGGSAQESKIIVNPIATEGFDFDYDSRFLAGYAPLLYSVVGDEMLSTNSLPELTSGKVIPFGFVKNAATTFTIKLKESIPGTQVYLTDKKTDIVTNLTETPVYSFTSSEGDDPNRFELKFGAVGIDDNIATEQISIYSHGRLVYISSTKSANALISIYNITGQQVYANTMVIDGQKQIALNTPTGWYIVKVRTQQGVATQK